MSELYDFSVRSLEGEEILFSRYEENVILAVNTASRCGFTPQYARLEELYQNYAADGLVVPGFPCNQFSHQEPGGADSIRKTCQIRYGITFPVFAKINVKGPETHPLFRWLTGQLPGRIDRDIKWNFTKFLTGRDRTPLQRFAPVTAPRKLDSASRPALGKST